MKSLPLLTALVLVGSAATAEAQFLEVYNATPNVTIPDNDLTGVASTITVPGSSILDITSLTVTLTVTGGFNGDFFAYLVHTAINGSSAGFVTLLNRVGTTSGNPDGYADSGFDVTFTNSGSDIHLYQLVSNPAGGQLFGTWSPDGRAVSPFAVTDATPRTDSLLSFNGFGAAGTWTLYIADVAGGDQGQFVSWGLQIAGVPEPSTWAVGVGALSALGWRLRRRRTPQVES
ncbi:MAG: PEP-CTERM sorting domain-containing protein [Verrucomicrobia bacterium]|nr:PEP-CTERM sorting domain-containing protein [Verrucomicrobiota bacterium]